MNKRLTKKEIEGLQKQAKRKPRLAWDEMTQKEVTAAFDLAEAYKNFLDNGKTEREAARAIIDVARKNRFSPISPESGGPVFSLFRQKAVALARLGKRPVTDGCRLIAAHIDSPRLDLKQNPLYEEVDLSFLKTHYYGGIRKYHWLARPLAIHGRILTTSGEPRDVVLGEDESDPVFTVLDLLPHLARKSQGNKKLSEAFEGEKLNVLCASLPIGDDKVKERFKLNVLRFLLEKYGIVEEDLVTAEIEVVPAGRARDVGVDRSMVGAYGQDDRIAAFSALSAIMEAGEPEHAAVVLFFDKEEIGSDGNTGAKSRFLEIFLSDLLEMSGEGATEQNLRRALFSTMALSADVNGALDPDYQEVHEKRNAARLGYGVCVTKFTGSGGKYGSSDASAEYLSMIRRIFNDNKVVWQTGELGKVDEGGGGTIAKFLAVHGMEVVDCGPALLSMHSPFEISSKADLFMTSRAYRAFLLS